MVYVAIWSNDCIGDVTLDGRTDLADVDALWQAYATSPGDPAFNPNADLNKDRHIDDADVALLTADLGCQCRQCEGQRIGDANCDGGFDAGDIDAFVLAMSGGEDAWNTAYGAHGCAFLCVNDINGDGSVDTFDVDSFIQFLLLAG
jgi:hypothetical protein